MYDPVLFSIIALVVSIASVVILIMKEGIGLVLGYRESSETSRRRREIDSKLRAEVRKDEQKFLVSLTRNERDEEKELESLMELGRSAFFARSICGNLLEDMTHHMNSALKFFSIALLASVFTLYVGVNSDFTTQNNVVVFLFFISVTIFSFYLTTREFRRHYLLRERFVRLGENANLEYCRKLAEELEDEGLWS